MSRSSSVFLLLLLLLVLLFLFLEDDLSFLLEDAGDMRSGDHLCTGLLFVLLLLLLVILLLCPNEGSPRSIVIGSGGFLILPSPPLFVPLAKAASDCCCRSLGFLLIDPRRPMIVCFGACCARVPN